MKTYDTLSEAISDLQRLGYVEDFNLKGNCLECRARQMTLFTDEFEVDSTYRFEGESNPDDTSILFAISSEKHHIKGLLVDAYGAYGDSLTMEMINKLKYKPFSK